MGLLTWLTRNSDTDRDDFEAEGVVEFASARGSLTYRDYKDRQRVASWRKVAAAWTIALTRRRIVVRWGRKSFVDLEWADPRIADLDIGVDDAGKLLIAYRAEKLADDARGTVEIRAKVTDARAVVRAFRSLST